MPIVQSRGTLRSVERSPAAPAIGPSRSGLDVPCGATYAAIYRTQPSVRTVVSFLARNVADLGLHVFRRVSDIDRVYLIDHELATWIAKPNPAMTHYRMVENLMNDMGVFFNGYWLKLRGDPTRLWFVRLPPETVTVDGWLLPSVFWWTLPDGNVVELKPRDVVHFNGYDPDNPLMGLSPIETLRQILAEEANATLYRRAYYANSSRVEGVITRPAGAPKWTPEQKSAFREQWQLRYAGPANVGSVAVLEDGMTFTNTSYSPRESQFTEARKLTDVEVARSYHVPLPMVGILDHATFSNIREQHKNLYQDCLGPWLTMLQEEFERQLLPECDDQDGIYTEFNIDQKLRGSFEEQAAAMQTLVGRPVVTLNEGRARLNLPSIKNDPGADRVAQPLNMTTTPTPPSLPADAGAAAIGGGITGPVIQETWRRQAARLRKVLPEDRAGAFDRERWDRELTHDLAATLRDAGLSREVAMREAEAIAVSVNADTAEQLAAGGNPFALLEEAV
jgi:HK97 family phage portal protein